jgi:hypothetical protein
VVVLTPRPPLRIPAEMRTVAAVVNSDLGAAQPTDVFLSQDSARAIEAVCLLMVDSFDLETLMCVVPCCCVAGVHSRSLAMPANERDGLAFRIENCWDGVSSALPNHSRLGEACAELYERALRTTGSRAGMRWVSGSRLRHHSTKEMTGDP